METNETICKQIASVDQSDIEFLMTGDSDTYIDLDLKLFIKGKLTKEDSSNLDATDYIAGINNLLHSLFTQCSISLNGTQITQTSELYNYRAYIETLLTYGNDAAHSHLKMPYWYLGEGNMKGGDATKYQETNNGAFITRWNKMKERQEIQMYGRIHPDICNVPLHLLSDSDQSNKSPKSFLLVE